MRVTLTAVPNLPLIVRQHCPELDTELSSGYLGREREEAECTKNTHLH